MAAPAGAPRPNYPQSSAPPPNYVPNVNRAPDPSLSQNFQNLQMNQPQNDQMAPSSAHPFSHSPSGQVPHFRRSAAAQSVSSTGPSPFSMPGLPHFGQVPHFPPSTAAQSVSFTGASPISMSDPLSSGQGSHFGVKSISSTDPSPSSMPGLPPSGEGPHFRPSAAAQHVSFTNPSPVPMSGPPSSGQGSHFSSFGAQSISSANPSPFSMPGLRFRPPAAAQHVSFTDPSPTMSGPPSSGQGSHSSSFVAQSISSTDPSPFSRPGLRFRPPAAAQHVSFTDPLPISMSGPPSSGQGSHFSSYGAQSISSTGPSPPFGSRPLSQPPFPLGAPAATPPGAPPSFPPSSQAVAPPSAARPGGFGPPPMSAGLNVPHTSAQGVVGFVPPKFSAGMVPGGPPFPASGGLQQPPVGPPPSAAPFTAPSQIQGTPSGSPFGLHTTQTRMHQVAPAPVPGSVQPPRMYGIPPPAQTMATMPAMGQSGASMTGPSKIDPNQIPRPLPSSSLRVFETHSGSQTNLPPPATSEYIVKDTGNCSPRYMRCTINQVPCTADLLETSGMQLALLVQPLALPHPSEEPIKVVDFGEDGPVRCLRCKTYINPFVKFIEQGRRFICNFCGSSNETPRDYHCNLGPDGRRRDVDERPELCRGTVEFVASKEYMVRDPMPAVFFFLVDVSMSAVQTGATAAACRAINQVIDDLPEGPRTMVGVATFDSTIHFYNLKRELQQPLMLIVPDVQDVYTPLETDVIVRLSECRQHVASLLESIPTMFETNKTSDSALGASVKGAFLAMKSTGGKILAFQSVLPSIGVGALSAREAEGRTNISTGDKEANKFLQPADKTLKEMAIEFAEFQVCVDIFITTQSYVDLASISVVPRTTGGQVYYYYPFSAISDTSKLYNDLRWNVTRSQGFEAVMRVRCSQGLQVQEYSGNFCRRIPTDIDLPAIDCDKTVMVSLKHDDKLQDGTECAFQCALLYTTAYGQRRIRVSTLSLPCTSVLSNLFRSADVDTQFSCYMKQAAIEIPTTSLMQVKDRMTNRCVDILHSYRKFCANLSQSSTGQLILPEALKLLPLYTLALIKSAGLRSDGRFDDRSFWINYVSSLSTPLAVPLVYPRMISVHDLGSKGMDEPVIPSAIPLSSEHLSNEGIYLLENGEDALVYVTSSVDPGVLQCLFDTPSVDKIPTQFVLQQYDNPLSKKFNEVVNEIRRQRCSYLRFKLCKKGDPSGLLFLSYMVEDKSPTGPSYVEFLVHIHRQIQNKMP